jgi:hypothetical protein
MRIPLPILQFDRQAAFGGPRGRTNDRRVWNILIYGACANVPKTCPTICIKAASASFRDVSVKADSCC